MLPPKPQACEGCMTKVWTLPAQARRFSERELGAGFGGANRTGAAVPRSALRHAAVFESVVLIRLPLVHGSKLVSGSSVRSRISGSAADTC